MHSTTRVVHRGPEPVDRDPRRFKHKKSAPWPVRRGGWLLVVCAAGGALCDHLQSAAGHPCALAGCVSGCGVTAVLFEAGKFGLGFYLGSDSTASTYGAAASVVLLLRWLNAGSSLLAAENAGHHHHAPIHFIPSDNRT